MRDVRLAASAGEIWPSMGVCWRLPAFGGVRWAMASRVCICTNRIEGVRLCCPRADGDNEVQGSRMTGMTGIGGWAGVPDGQIRLGFASDQPQIA